MNGRRKYQLTRDRVMLLLTLGGRDARRLEDTGVVHRHFKLVGARPLAIDPVVRSTSQR